MKILSDYGSVMRRELSAYTRGGTGTDFYPGTRSLYYPQILVTRYQSILNTSAVKQYEFISNNYESHSAQM